VKTQIIQLETHDDTISVKDKMDWAQTPRVLLIWPDEGKILRNRLDLVVLERYCTAKGSQLALLTRDLEVIHRAEEVGIPVFRSRSEAQLQPWRKSFKEFQRQEIYQDAQQVREKPEFEHQSVRGIDVQPLWARILIFSIAVLGVLAIGATLLPSSIITLPHESRTQTINIPIQAIPNQDRISISGIIPSRYIDVIVEDKASTPSTGLLDLPVEYATGEVTFTNLGENSIEIPENTVLSTTLGLSPRFVTKSPGFVPEGKGSQIVIPIQALEPGTTGNVSENMITLINQELGADLSVTNPMPTSGGEDIQLPAPSEIDHQGLTIRLKRDLEIQAVEKALLQINEEDVLISPEPEFSEVIDIQTQPEIGSAGESLTINSSMNYRFLFVAGDDLMQLAENAIITLSEDESYRPDLESITIDHLSDPEMDTNQIAFWEIEISWEEKRIYNHQLIIQTILGEKPQDAQVLLKKTLDLTQVPEIKLKPSWWGRIPALPFRIMILEAND
jgi:hypothetical protein